MSRENDKYTQSFSNRVTPETWKAFKATVPRGHNLNDCFEQAMRLWVDLPDETRSLMLLGGKKDPLADIIVHIVDARIAERQGQMANVSPHVALPSLPCSMPLGTRTEYVTGVVPSGGDWNTQCTTEERVRYATAFMSYMEDRELAEIPDIIEKLSAIEVWAHRGLCSQPVTQFKSSTPDDPELRIKQWTCDQRKRFLWALLWRIPAEVRGSLAVAAEVERRRRGLDTPLAADDTSHQSQSTDPKRSPRGRGGRDKQR